MSTPLKSDSVVHIGFDFSQNIDQTTQVTPGKFIEFDTQRMASPTVKLACCAVGIFVCFFYYGILQERITRSTYGEEEKFTTILSLVCIQCIVNTLFAKLLLHTFMKEGEDPTSQKYYGILSFTYLSAMVSSNLALRHVNYPTQVVGKSCKPIPVMILSVLVGKKRYPLKKYLFIFLIVIGIGLFMYKDRPAVVSENDEPTSMIGMGEILLLISLSLDGITGGVQSRIKHEYQSKAGHMMFYMNLWSTAYVIAGILATGEVFEFVTFIGKYPYVLYDILMFSIMSALGQLFIFLTIQWFGPLLCSIMTTTRKFFTVLGSVFLFGNVMTSRQWFGTSLVFLGLTLDSFYGKEAPKEEKKEKE